MSECKMNVKVLQSTTLTATRYLMIAVAMLHTSLGVGATSVLRVTYSPNHRDDEVQLECRDLSSGFIVSGATFTFKDPGTERMEDSVQAAGSSYTFTIHPDNESLVTCTIESRESDPVKVGAIPRYPGVTAIKQYTYSDSDVVNIECPFQIGRLRELYEFSWDGVLGPGDVQPITNGTVGVYWLAEEDNRILHINISATILKEFQCVGEVRTCQTSSSCQPTERNSPTINITTTAGGAADLAMITNHPNSTTVNEGEVATFSCTVTGRGDLTIEWDVDEVQYNMDNCSASESCSRINITDNTGGSVTSTLEVTASLIANSVTCVMKQNLSSSTISFGLPVVGVEVRPPPVRMLRSEPAQLTVILSGGEQIICPDLTIANGVVGTSPPGRVFMSRTIYTCNDGFALKGDGNRVCQIDMWNGTDPECVPILPPTPVLVQGLCSVVFWYSPEVPCSEVSGYDVRLYSPQSGQQNVTRRVGANGTFYVLKDEDILAGSGETYVQVRIIHSGREGEWSEGISLGCEKPTVSETPRVYFMLAEKVYRNNSVIPLTEVGEGDNALLCKTDKEKCCGTVPNRFGEFYYPNGVQVPIANRRQGFYRNRGDQIIRLNRREGITSPTGTYRCEIPNADDVIVTIYVTLTGN